ncbi:hypothetical protein [Pseudomonas veronii]|uniref:hypothetical protein n=1 Tax=Pseudomonas veronii TaxID=76761 RepID=UPI003988D935
MATMNAQLIELRTLAAKAENHRTETGLPREAMVQIRRGFWAKRKISTGKSKELQICCSR